jgi:large subunit ribosomal protein L21
MAASGKGTYAVVESGGKQYRVEQGSSLVVDRLSAEAGAKVSLRPVMLRDGEIIADEKGLAKVKIEATVAEHLRGPKIRISKYKAKKGYRRRAGYRSELTRLEVTSIKQEAARKKPAATTKEKESDGA